MSDKTDKKSKQDWGKKWIESDTVFLPKDKPEAMAYLHEYLGIPIKRA